MSTVPVGRMSWLRCLYSTVAVLSPMLCIRSGVSWTGTSGVSIFCPGVDGAGSFAPEGGPEATGCTSPDIGIFIALGCFAKWERYAQVPAKTPRIAIQTSEVLNTYLFIAVSLLSEFRGVPKQLHDQQESARIRASS